MFHLPQPPSLIIKIFYLSNSALALQIQLLEYQAEDLWEELVYRGSLPGTLLVESPGLGCLLRLAGDLLGLLLFDRLVGEVTVRPVGDVLPRPGGGRRLIFSREWLRGEIIVCFVEFSSFGMLFILNEVRHIEDVVYVVPVVAGDQPARQHAGHL